jgi:ATP-binding cassette, subfamily B, multidrug efflux pump
MKSLAYLNKYLRKYKWHVFWGVIFIIAANIFAVLMPKVVDDAIDLVTDKLRQAETLDNPSELFESLWYDALLLGGLYILYSLIKGLFTFFQRQTIIIMSRHIEFDLKNEIYDHYQRLSLSFYKRNKTGDIMNRISEDVSKVRMYLGPGIMYTINLAVLFLTVVPYMLYKNVELTLYVLSPLPVLTILIYYVSNQINKKSELVQRKQSGLSTFVQEAFSGIRVIKAYNREKYQVNAFEEEAESYKDASVSLAKTQAFFMPIIMVLIGLSTILTIYIGGLKVISGELDYGDIAQFVIYINMLTWPFASVGWITSIIQRAAASQERINEFLKEKTEIKNSDDAKDFVNGDIAFNNVSFEYPDSGIKALKGVSFTIEKNKITAFTGKIGSGKSTIANLIGRLYDTSKGSISINGTDIKTLDLEQLRNAIGYVPQEVFLFSDSIENNISFGKTSTDENTEADIIQAAKIADVHSNIIEFKHQYKTLLGERGITLSGGQKQRVSIARSVLRKAPVLIFDDCLSAVDTETEEKIMHNMNEVMKERTSVIISHRISSIKNADKIIVLDEGNIIQEGTHKELINQPGLYKELYEKQLLAEKLA